tara:strand:- start:169 stop:1101 length:933 start_codon:yes stop_codon:yes gene_type:complete
MSYGSFANNYNSPLADLGGAVAGTRNKAGGMFSSFRNNKVVSGTTDFLYSNTLVAKVCFFILVLILFVYAIRIGAMVLGYLNSPNQNPILIDGLKPGKKFKVVPQDPKEKGSKPVIRSVNEREGLEFTWSVWLFIDDLVYKTGQRKHVFHKGSSGNIGDKSEFDGVNVENMAFPNNAPGLYIHETKNALVIVMNTFNNVIEEVEVDDVPLNKWILVNMRCRGKHLDTYINGTIVNRHEFRSVPKQNYGDVFVNWNGGFSGLVSNLRYHNYALSGVDIENMVRAGPNLRADDSIKIFPPYFSLRWFFSSDI